MKRRIKTYLADRNGRGRTESVEIIGSYCSNPDNTTIQLIMLWGASDKPNATKADKDALLYLIHFINELEDIFHKDCELTIVFTDTHVYLNGYELNTMESYYADIKYHLRKHKFSFTYCSDLLSNYVNVNEFANWQSFIDDILDRPIELFNTTDICEEQALVFKDYAYKHCNRLIGNKSCNTKVLNTNEASKAYLYLSSVEKQIIEEHFPESLFITYMNKEEDFVLPNLPVVRLYSLKSGLRTRPWFTN